MTLTNFSTDSTASPAVPPLAAGDEAAAPPSGFADRRAPQRYSNNQVPAGRERRQFGSSHAGLSEEGRELAAAIDRYKLEHHRRYLTCDEMLTVLHRLGYERVTDLK